jgi:hypothetical protein
LHNDIDQALRVVRGVVTAGLPPHPTPQFHGFDVLNFLRRNLRTIIRDHSFRVRIKAPACNGLVVMQHFGAGSG